jgi:hypothetical protein
MVRGPPAVLLPAEGKSTLAVVDVLVSARGVVLALASAFVALQMHRRGVGAGVEKVTVQLSMSVAVFGLVKAPALLFEPAVKLPVPTRVAWCEQDTLLGAAVPPGSEPQFHTPPIEVATAPLPPPWQGVPGAASMT